VIIYQTIGKEIPIAEVWDDDLLRTAKERAIRDARMKLQLVRETDPVMRINAEMDLRRMQRTLDRLIPCKYEL